MVKAVIIRELGGPEVMKWEDVEIGEPKDGEIRVKNKAIGVNFIDVYFRKGVYKTDLPFTPGREAVGIVTAVGPGLTGRKVGDVVAYAGNPMGSYTEEQILPARVAVPVPSSVDFKVAASIMLKGMTAHMLLRRCFKVEPGHRILVHAAAGGVGSLLCQWANALGATVIGTVSNEEKAVQAKEDGCHHVIIYTKEDFVTAVDNITSGEGVNVVYDAVGKDTFQVLKWEEVEVGEPKEGEIRVRNKAIGVNFDDVHFRRGVYKSDLPFTPGVEAVGVVTEVGPGLTGRKVGDVVAYGGSPFLGSYAEEQILPASIVVPVPPAINYMVVASVTLKGMTAHMLLRRCFKVERGHTILVHAAAGGVGSLLCQWGNALGATVIGTVSSEEKAAQAMEDGCHHTIIYTKEDFVAKVEDLTSGMGVNVVYDSVGKDTFRGSLQCLAPRGYMISFGQSSGQPDPFTTTDLAAKSMFLVRPSLEHYNATRDELLEAAGEVFSLVSTGVLKVRTNHICPLSEAAFAHAELEARKTTGSIVLIPDGELCFPVRIRSVADQI